MIKMTLNYIHTVEIIPKLINGNKELFYNEILNSKENLKAFLERDSYFKACDKLKIDSNTSFTIEEIEDEMYENTRIIYISFFDNYLSDENDTKSIAFVINNGILKYYRVSSNNTLYDFDIESLNEDDLIKFEQFDKNKIINFILNNSETLKVPVGISARHVHVTKEDLETLFGAGFELEVERMLTQKPQFASKQTVTIRTNAGEFANVRILGPVRPYTQIEISKTDAFKLKLNPPVRDSGDLIGSEGITIIGPKGEVKKEYGCIIADRHIHLTPDDLVKYKLDKNKLYKVRVKGEKGGIMNNVHLKVDENYTFEIHIDTDDANAFLIKNADELEIIK